MNVRKINPLGKMIKWKIKDNFKGVKNKNRNRNIEYKN
jgi:hypothetical protein